MKWELSSFENLSNSQSESNRAIVGGVEAVTLLRNRVNKCVLLYAIPLSHWHQPLPFLIITNIVTCKK